MTWSISAGSIEARSPFSLTLSTRFSHFAPGLLHAQIALSWNPSDQQENGQPGSSAREYEYGDPWQYILWKATARRQMLMVREFEAEKAADPLLWLDPSMQSYGEDEHALETAISLAASP